MYGDYKLKGVVYEVNCNWYSSNYGEIVPAKKKSIKEKQSYPIASDRPMGAAEEGSMMSPRFAELDDEGSDDFVFEEQATDDVTTETFISSKNFSQNAREKVIAMTEEAIAYLILADSDIDNERFTECILNLPKWLIQYAIAAEKLLPETTVIDRIESMQSDIASETIYILSDKHGAHHG